MLKITRFHKVNWLSLIIGLYWRASLIQGFTVSPVTMETQVLPTLLEPPWVEVVAAAKFS